METVKNLATSHPYLTGVAAVATAAVIHHVVLREKKPKLADAPPNTVVLYQLPRGPYAPSLSPFPLKLETYLRVAGIPYKNVFGMTMSQKGKTPWISYNNEPMADSQLIMEFLNKEKNVDLNKNLTKNEQALAHALRVMVDEHLYWCLVYFRWILDTEKKLLASDIPKLVIYLFSNELKKQLQGQGLGRHTAAEIRNIMMRDLQTLDDTLGDKPFLMGDTPTEVDCSAFGLLCQFVFHSSDDVMAGLIQDRFPSLYQYCERMKSRVWPDWDDCTTCGNTTKATK